MFFTRLKQEGLVSSLSNWRSFFSAAFAIPLLTTTGHSALAQPIIDEFISGTQVRATGDCAMLKVNFHTRVRYAGHFPLNRGDELKINLKIIDRLSSEPLRMVRREGVKVDNPEIAAIQSVTLDLDQTGGPILRVQFTRPIAYQVSQFGDFESIGVVVQKAESSKKCSAADFANPVAEQIDRSGGGLGARAASVRSKEVRGGKVSATDVKLIEASLDEARAAIKKSKFSEAIALLKKVLKYPENQFSPEAQELLGVAKQKAGQTDAARAEFDDYLLRYPNNEGSARVQQRLGSLQGAPSAAPERLRGSNLPALVEAGAAKKEHKDENRWFASGSVSNYYIKDDSTNTVKDISIAPNPNADPDAHRSHQNTFLTNFDLYGSIVNENVKTKFKLAATDEHRLVVDQPDVDRYGISTAFVESTLRDTDITARVGRQTRNTGGVIGRFDGGVITWQASDSLRLNAVAGSPNWSRFDAPFKDGKLLYGASADFGRVIEGLDTSLFAIEEDDRSVTNRRAVGTEFRYFNNGKAVLGTIDYDVYFKRLNAAIFSGSWTLEDKSVFSAGLDYRKVPYLASWNALQGQPFLTLYDMLKYNSMDEVRRFALDRTPTFESGMASYSRPLNDNYQVSVDATVTRLSGTAPSGGVDGTRPSGTEYYLSAQLLGTSLFKQGDMFIGALRYASLSDSKVYFLDLNTRYPLTDNLRISPRARFGYRYGTTTDLKETTILPSFLINYSLTKDIGLEAEIGYKWMWNDLAGVRSTTKDLFLTVGLRSDFSTEGMYRCAGILAPCMGKMLTGPARIDEAQLAHDTAFYGPALYEHSAPPSVTSAFVVEGGLRYWYSSGKNRYTYFADDTPTLPVSKLSYDKLAAHSGEAFFRADARHGLIRNFFLKGTIGGGGVNGGKLIDEDLPPVVDPYSKTISDVSGQLRHGSVDLGYNVYSDERIRLGAFLGFHSTLESVNASGCTQVGGNSSVCGQALPKSLKLINERDRWNSFRVGALVDVNLTDRLKWNGEIALTSTSQRAQDIHYATFGADPAKGHGGGFQAESILSYRFTDNFSLGVGGRWWHLKTHADDMFGQLLKYETDRYGVFVQGSYKLNLLDYPVEIAEDVR